LELSSGRITGNPRLPENWGSVRFADKTNRNDSAGCDEVSVSVLCVVVGSLA
jgi:hypothetical protein